MTIARNRSPGAWRAGWRDALASLLIRPRALALAVVILALGIATGSAAFTVLWKSLLQPLPIAGQERLVVLNEIGHGDRDISVSYLGLRDWQARTRTLDRLAAAMPVSGLRPAPDGAERVVGALVTHDYLGAFGVRPTAGRDLMAEDDRAGAAPTVLVSARLAERAFGPGEPATGRTLVLDGESYTVVGVVDAGFEFPSARTEFWRPIAIERDADFLSERSAHPGLYAIGRLAPGVGIEAVRAEFDAIQRELQREHPQSYVASGVRVTSLERQLFGDLRVPLALVFGAAVCVFLLSCVNVSGLLLLRALARRQEWAIRSALGAGRARLVRQGLVESLLVACAGAALGIAVADLATATLLRTYAPNLPRLSQVGVDGTVLAFGVVLALLAALLCGLAPALRSARIGHSARGATSPVSRDGLRASLVLGQFGLSAVLLVGAVLMGETLARLRATALGYDVEQVATARLLLPESAYRSPESAHAFHEALLERARALPGLASVALSSVIPLGPNNAQNAYLADGAPSPGMGRFPSADINTVSDGFLATLGVPLLRGRDFAPDDGAGREPVAIVDERLAASAWPGEDAIGRLLILGHDTGPDARRVRVIGVARHIENYGVGRPSMPQVYLPSAQAAYAMTSLYLVARARGDTGTALAPLRGLVREIDARVAVHGERTLAQYAEGGRLGQRLLGVLLGGYSALAMLLAFLGLGALVAQLARERTREVGVRVALGAGQGDVARLLLRQGLSLGVLGTVLGLAVASGAVRLLASQLHGVEAHAPGPYLLAVAVLAIGAVLASLPGLRIALRVSPSEALRHD